MNFVSKKMLVPSMIISGEMTDADRQCLTDLEKCGADAFLLFDFSESDAAHEEAILFLRETAKKTNLPILCGGHTPRFEDVKKLLYAGAAYAVVDMRQDAAEEVLKEGAARFGKERIAAYAENIDVFHAHGDAIQKYTSLLISKDSIDVDFPLLWISGYDNAPDFAESFNDPTIVGVSGKFVSVPLHLAELKTVLKEKGLVQDSFTCQIPFSEFKLNSDGLIPVIVQDYRTDQVLMLAYMNEESFEETLRTGKMTYFSRSRSTLWTKGESSGHFQYVKELRLDCDKDTILAKVKQIGPACHTGSQSCFFNELIPTVENHKENSIAVLDDVYDTIMDRKVHPKEGSYTNYLFDKGIDKILKKVGEESTEIVIAAKNPEPEEIIYEIADFLYHVSVLMADKEITWQQIADELVNRE